jgi:MFS family permease
MERSPAPLRSLSAESSSSDPVRRPRLAISGVYLIAGLMLGTWFARLPELRIQLGLSDGELGAVLLAQMAGLIIAMQFAEALFVRFGHRKVVWLITALVPWCLPLMATIHGLVPATAAMFSWGLIAGVIDVGMNALGVRTERMAGRPILNSLHAVWGAGALVGSLATAAVVRAGLAPQEHFLLVAALLSGIALLNGKHLLADTARPVQARRAVGADRPPVRADRPRTSVRTGWTRTVVVLGILGASAALCETSISSWCGIYLTQQRGALVSLASFGYTAFIVAETGTRMIGDRLHRRLGAVLLVRGSLAVTAIGLLIVLAIPALWADLAGFALQGCGIAVLIPIITGAVGHGGALDSSDSATSLAIARYSTLYYAGALAGPAVVGWLAQFFGITIAFALLVAPMLLVALLAGATAPASKLTGFSLPEALPAELPESLDFDDHLDRSSSQLQAVR